MEQHSFKKKIKCLPYLVCEKCGLVLIHNPFTKWCQESGCDYQTHPQFLAKKKQFTGK
jgi:hypothetical protein